MLLGRRLVKLIVAVLLFVGLSYVGRLNNSLPKSLTRDIANLIDQNASSPESPKQFCGEYFQKLYKNEPSWWNDYAEGQEHNTPDYENENLRLILERLRMYESCVELGALKSGIYDLDKRMYPFLRPGKTPKFQSGDLKTTYEGGILPSMADNGSFKYNYDYSDTWTSNWYRLSSQGQQPTRGIVLSFPDSHVSLVIRLLKVLHHQKNELPIQVIHKGDLSEVSKNLISEALSPSQNLWFVDVSSMLNKRFVRDFSGYKNKWLAMILNTFSEAVFIDADAVSMVSFKDYFEMDLYNQTGALFFKDRAFDHQFDYDFCVPMIKSLQPGKHETRYLQNRKRLIDLQLRNTQDPSTEQTIIKDFFEGYQRHQMDSGLVLIEKGKHLTALLAAVFLNLAPKLSKCTHGDKETFWLAFLLMNHEFSFHPEEASAIGKADENGEVCSVQLGHTSAEGDLLWFNSGFRTCKFADAIEFDWDGYPKEDLHSRFSSLEDARLFYESLVEIEAAALPNKHLNPWTGGFGDHCLGYRYCAKAGSGYGKLVHFEPQIQKDLKEIGEVWMKATNLELFFNDQ